MIFCERFAFMHVPKTAGLAVTDALLEVLPRPVYVTLPSDETPDAKLPHGVTAVTGIRHENLDQGFEVASRHGIDLSDVPVILAFLRDPYALEVSRYTYLRKGYEVDRGPNQDLALSGDFESFAINSTDHAGHPLHAYFLYRGERPDNLLIGKYESLEESLQRALEMAGLPTELPQMRRINASPHGDPRDYYTQGAEQAVFERYGWAFEHGGYERMTDEERVALPTTKTATQETFSPSRLIVVAAVAGTSAAFVANFLCARPNVVGRALKVESMSASGQDLQQLRGGSRLDGFATWALQRIEDALPLPRTLARSLMASRRATGGETHPTTMVCLSPWSNGMDLADPAEVGRMMAADPRIEMIFPIPDQTSIARLASEAEDPAGEVTRHLRYIERAIDAEAAHRGRVHLIGQAELEDLVLQGRFGFEPDPSPIHLDAAARAVGGNPPAQAAVDLVVERLSECSARRPELAGRLDGLGLSPATHR